MKRTHDIIGGLSLVVWLAVVVVVTFASAALPEWHIPNGTDLPPPDGCYHEINVSLSSKRFVCHGTPADALTEGALNYAVAWVVGIMLLPFLLFYAGAHLYSLFLADLSAVYPVVRFGSQLRIPALCAEAGGARDQKLGKRCTLTVCFPLEAEL